MTDRRNLKSLMLDSALALDGQAHARPCPPFPKRRRQRREWAVKAQEWMRNAQLKMAVAAPLLELAAGELPEPPRRGDGGRFVPKDVSS